MLPGSCPSGSPLLCEGSGTFKRIGVVPLGHDDLPPHLHCLGVGQLERGSGGSFSSFDRGG